MNFYLRYKLNNSGILYCSVFGLLTSKAHIRLPVLEVVGDPSTSRYYPSRTPISKKANQLTFFQQKFDCQGIDRGVRK